MTANELSWEDVLDYLERRMQDDLDKTVGHLMSHDDITGVPDWILIMVGDDIDHVQDLAAEYLAKLGLTSEIDYEQN